jgi:hypothetical protein
MEAVQIVLDKSLLRATDRAARRLMQTGRSRRASPGSGMARLSHLVPSGLYFGPHHDRADDFRVDQPGFVGS